jgi:hypothetical protein
MNTGGLIVGIESGVIDEILLTLNGGAKQHIEKQISKARCNEIIKELKKKDINFDYKISSPKNNRVFYKLIITKDEKGR